MSQRPIEQLTPREMLIEAERLARELIDHIERGFLPKARDLRRLVRSDKIEPETVEVEDVTIRTHAARVLESENFTAQLYGKLDKHLAAIDQAVTRIVNEGG